MKIISDAVDFDRLRVAKGGTWNRPPASAGGVRETPASAAPHSRAESSSPKSETLRQLAARGERSGHWKHTYRLVVPLIDSLVIIVAIVCAQVGRFGIPDAGGDDPGSAWVGLTIYSVALAAIWVSAIGFQQAWDLSLVGVGVEEYRRVLSATCWVFGIIATADLVLQLQMARGYLLIAFPVGVVGLLIGRHQVRRFVARKRLRGEYTNQVVVLGNSDSVVSLCASVDRAKSAGYSVVGACIPGFRGQFGSSLTTRSGNQVPILGDENSVETALRVTNADALAVAAVEQLGQDRMRKLAWQLDEFEVDMIVMPGMTDIAGPRLKTRPIDNLPLFHVARRRRDTMARYQKRIFDLFTASIALVLLSPLMILTAFAVKLGDGGPVFFRQERVGLHGRRFMIFKFRTMTVNAEHAVGVERQVANQADSVFYKSASDSRITPIGRFLRKSSIDEIPQLFNVLGGSMSLVGPRPLVPGEGASVENFVQRRGLMKPGMTGLWQISGRSDASAEERIRLDHSYVDNWSWIQDLAIVWRTALAVLRRSGAY